MRDSCFFLNTFNVFETSSYSFDVGSTVEVFIADNETFTGLFFQDAEMKTNFASFPELLMVDATHKLNELRMPLYLLLVVDGNGQSEIVGSFLTAIETEEAITKMVQAFKSYNANWVKTKVVIFDKDFTERAVFHKDFPSASLNYHLPFSHPKDTEKRSDVFETWSPSWGT